MKLNKIIPILSLTAIPCATIIPLASCTTTNVIKEVTITAQEKEQSQFVWYKQHLCAEQAGFSKYTLWNFQAQYKFTLSDELPDESLIVDCKITQNTDDDKFIIDSYWITKNGKEATLTINFKTESETHAFDYDDACTFSADISSSNLSLKKTTISGLKITLCQPVAEVDGLEAQILQLVDEATSRKEIKINIPVVTKDEDPTNFKGKITFSHDLVAYRSADEYITFAQGTEVKFNSDTGKWETVGTCNADLPSDNQETYLFFLGDYKHPGYEIFSIQPEGSEAFDCIAYFEMPTGHDQFLTWPSQE